MILQISDLCLSFNGKQILHQFGFELNQGEIACLLGQSGCGKTTALRCIAGFERPNHGIIQLKSHILNDAKQFVPAHKRKIGMVFQDYALFPHLNASENIAFGIQSLTKKQRLARVQELLEWVGLPEHGHHYPHQLSGGQQQRIALARALAPKPDLILLDEPFSSLDADLRTHLSKEIRQLLKQHNTSALVVTHDQNEAFAMADHIGMMAHGRLQQWGTPQQLYQQPATQIVAGFIGQGTFLRGKIQDAQHVDTIMGTLHTTPLPQQNEYALVLVRPEHIECTPPEHAQQHAHIKEKEFKGDHFVYTLELPNNEILTTQSPHDYGCGNQIGIRLLERTWSAFAET